MIRYIDHEKMGRGRHGWLDSHFHFSFAEYCNPDNVNFGVLRVMNDDTVQSGTGFDTHPHENMEIISYVVLGELSHRDSMGNERTLSRGQIQYMSAGTGVFHSEYNHGKEPLRFFQIWILPDGKDYSPNYGDVRFALEDRRGKWLHVAAPAKAAKNGAESAAPVKVHQDVNVYASIIDPGSSLDFTLGRGRQVYLALAEGGAKLTGRDGSAAGLFMRDAAEITGESFTVTADSGKEAHILAVEMAER
jgi:redox-sensitive bicupin YhaK (pirin superfamily)